MKRYLKLVFSVGLTFCLMLSLCFTSFADLKSLMIATDSNALMTMNLTDDDYGISLLDISSVNNTVDWTEDTYIRVYVINESTGKGINYYKHPAEIDDNGFRFQFTAPDGYRINNMYVYNVYLGDYSNFVKPGYYTVELEARSQFDNEISNVRYSSAYKAENTEEISSTTRLTFEEEGGDFYSLFNLHVTSGLERACVYWSYPGTVYNLDYTISESFIIKEYSTTTEWVESASPNVNSEQSTENYQNDVSSSLSDLSSSVDEVNEGISGITEAIENLQGAMEPHYNNVLQQMHHITEQLHAFYDQVYNNIHLPELDMLTQIKTAIENIDLQIEVDISEVKTAINNMSTAIQNKLQTTTDQITNGYDNSGIVQENEKLEQSINDYDEVESEIFDEAGGFVGEFEYPSIDSLSGGVIKALAFVGSFLQSIFLSMGDFSSIITFSLTMIFVMVVVGYHRIRS